MTLGPAAVLGSSGALNNMYGLRRLIVSAGWKPNISFDMRQNTGLTVSGFVGFLSALGANTGTALTITIPTALLGALTAAQKQIATDKNYILAGA